LRERNILADGKRHRVKLLRAEKGGFLAEVDENLYEVELTGELRYGTPLSIRVGGKPYSVELRKINKSKPFSIKVNDKTFTIQYEPTESPSPRTGKPAPLTLARMPTNKLVVGEGVVAAPMPGRVVLLKVKVGDSVKAGDGLCVLEAMKMENEITASKTGVVKEIRVSEGSNVNRGEALMIIG
jgi:biotin carboxyl carrier protein